MKRMHDGVGRAFIAVVSKHSAHIKTYTCTDYQKENTALPGNMGVPYVSSVHPMPVVSWVL